MAIVLNETFATGIPSGFATAVESSGTFTATYNATAQAVDLAKDNFNGGWRFDGVSASSQIDVAFDVEALDVSSAGAGTFFGIYLGEPGGSGSGALIAYSRIVADGNSGAGLANSDSSWGFGAGIDTESVGRPIFTFTVGQRKLIKFRSNLDGGDRVVEFVIDGQPYYRTFRAVGAFAGNVRPTLFLRSGSIRLHSVVVRDDAAVITEPLKYGRVTGGPQRYLTSAPISQLAGVIARSVVRKNVYQGGAGLIQGIVDVENVPASRKVRLYDRATGVFVAETTSSVTGNYEFRDIDETREYFAVSHDHFRIYNAVISDMINP
jgi:hypothetical protein